MNLAVFTTKFPDLTETFIQAEVEYLASEYKSLRVCTLKPAEKTSLTVDYYAWWDPRNFYSFLICWLTNFSEMTKIATQMWLGFSGCPRSWERLKSFLLWPAACRFSRCLKAQGVSHLMSHWANVPSTVAWICHRLNKCSLIMVLHGENLSSIWPLLKIKCKEADCVITCTEFNKRRLENEIDNLEVIFHPHGVVVPKNLEQKERSETIKGLSVARLVKTKGLHLLLQALSTLKKQGDNIFWTIIGEGPEENDLKKYCRDHGLSDNVTFKGAIDYKAVLTHYHDHHMFALPIEVAKDGDSDGLPNVILEAMARNCAVISSRCAAVEEAVIHGETGLLIDSGDCKTLIAALREYKNNVAKREKMAKAARIFVSENFDRAYCHQKLKKTLELVLG